MQKLFVRVLAFFVSAVLSFMGTQNHVKDAGLPFGPENETGILLNAAVVSDTHTNGWTPHAHNVKLMKLLCGVSKSETPLDALVIPGDLTETARTHEYAILSELLGRYAKAQVILSATGNHDVRGLMGVVDYEKNMRNYYAFCGTVGVQTDKPYWSQTVNGYTFVVLGSDSEVKDSAYVSPAQMRWLNQTLREAEEAARPVFIICHQPLAHTNNVDKSWPGAGTLGEQSDAVEAILKRHADAGLPIVWISGHLHDDFSAYSFETPHENLYCLNLPSAQYNDGGRGVMLEAYADRVLFRTRDFISGEWLGDTYTVLVER